MSTDVVFALDQPNSNIERDVVLNISGLLWTGGGHVDSAWYREETKRLVDGLQDRGRSVTLLAHVDGRGRDDDVYAINDFLRSYHGKLECIVPKSLNEVRSTLAGSQLVIGARMHACLNALSCWTPAIAWAYSRKFVPLMRDLGWEHVIDLTSSNTEPARDTLTLMESLHPTEVESRLLKVQSTAAARLKATVEVLQGALP